MGEAERERGGGGRRGNGGREARHLDTVELRMRQLQRRDEVLELALRAAVAAASAARREALELEAELREVGVFTPERALHLRDGAVQRLD